MFLIKIKTLRMQQMKNLTHRNGVSNNLDKNMQSLELILMVYLKE